MATRDFTFMLNGPVREDNTREPLWRFTMHALPRPDLTGRPDDGVVGENRFFEGDRIAYHTAYAKWQHHDPDHHDFVDAVRFVLQNVGSPCQVNDKYMPELPQQGSTPYPYEKERVVPTERSHPGGTVEIFHQRFGPGGLSKFQLLDRIVIPAVSEVNPKLKWFYQYGGIFVAEHDELGIVARMIVAAQHPRYGFHIKGIPAALGGGFLKENERF